MKPYHPQYFDEMDIKEGDVIAFMDELEDGWWRGMKLGNPSPVRSLPCYFVQLIRIKTSFAHFYCYNIVFL